MSHILQRDTESYWCVGPSPDLSAITCAPSYITQLCQSKEEKCSTSSLTKSQLHKGMYKITKYFQSSYHAQGSTPSAWQILTDPCPHIYVTDLQDCWEWMRLFIPSSHLVTLLLKQWERGRKKTELRGVHLPLYVMFRKTTHSTIRNRPEQWRGGWGMNKTNKQKQKKSVLNIFLILGDKVSLRYEQRCFQRLPHELIK